MNCVQKGGGSGIVTPPPPPPPLPLWQERIKGRLSAMNYTVQWNLHLRDRVPGEISCFHDYGQQPALLPWNRKKKIAKSDKCKEIWKNKNKYKQLKSSKFHQNGKLHFLTTCHKIKIVSHFNPISNHFNSSSILHVFSTLLLLFCSTESFYTIKWCICVVFGEITWKVNSVPLREPLTELTL